MVRPPLTLIISSVIHLILLSTQLLQLLSATRTRRATASRCPHCKHNMEDLPSPFTPYSAAEDTAQPTAQPSMRQTQDSLVYADDEDAVTVVGMAPGQQTGTCTRTPRISSSSDGVQQQQEHAASSTANETGESEGDRLIEKSELRGLVWRAGD